MTDIVERLRKREMLAEIGRDKPDIYRDAADEIKRLREENEKMKYFLQHNVFAEKQYGVYFVCGEAGDKDLNGVPEHIFVCPAYGSDITYCYNRIDSSDAPTIR